MFKNINKRGSILLMVVGLLVILGTLGGTFLLISSLDAKQSKLLAGRGGAERMGSGAIGQVVRMLARDLHFDPTEKSSAPYTESYLGNESQYAMFFADYRSPTQDKHLFSSASLPSEVIGTSGQKVSTDSQGGAKDSYLIGTGEFSPEGEEYYIAIKVEDLCAKRCLNTGGKDYISGTSDVADIIRTPALISINSFSTIHGKRGGQDLQKYDLECGRRLMSPMEGYTPFPVTDEVFLRWMGTDKEADFGGVFDALGTLGSDTKKDLTTTNSHRSITRSPLTKVISGRFDLSQKYALNGDGKDGFYGKVVMIAGSIDGKGGDIKSSDPTTIDNEDRGFVKSKSKWRLSKGMSGTVGSSARRSNSEGNYGWWVFEELPQATYKVWTSWGTAEGKSPASNVPYEVISGGAKAGSSSFSGGKTLGTFMINQTVPPEKTIDGQKWQSLGSYTTSGTLAVKIGGPRFVPDGETQFAFADAVRIEGVKVNMGAGSRRAAHLVANTWAAMAKDTEANANRAFAFQPKDTSTNAVKGKAPWVVFGVHNQPFITEAFAINTSQSVTLKDEEGAQPVIDKNAWHYAFAIEVMNFGPNNIVIEENDDDKPKYALVYGKELGNSPDLVYLPDCTIPKNGGRVILYDFKDGKDEYNDDNAAELFGRTEINGWKRVEGLSFDQKTIRLVQITSTKNDPDDENKKDEDQGVEYIIPIDHITAGDKANDDTIDLEYPYSIQDIKDLAPPTEQKGKTVSKTIFANCRRDDKQKRHRYSVAMYWRPDPAKKETENVYDIDGKLTIPIDIESHKLNQENWVDLTKLPASKLQEGFQLKLQHGLLAGPGDFSNLYVTGPIIQASGASGDTGLDIELPADLPHLLKAFATKNESPCRGRANSYTKNTERFDKDEVWNRYPRTRNGQDLAWPLLLSEITETVPMDVYRGDSPTRVYGRLNVNTASKDVLNGLPSVNGVTGSSMAGKIVEYRDSHGGFSTPGEVALALNGLVQKQEESLDKNRDILYGGISSCITVNSDMYAVTVRVQIGNDLEPDKSWYYLAIIDRGCVKSVTDKPAVLLFTQIE
jgi:hypothetical protein